MLIVHPASQCDVCLEKYDFLNPRAGTMPWAISCGHVFCEKCLHTINPKICPLCRKHFDSQRIKKLIVDSPPEDGNAQLQGEYVAHMETLSLVLGANTPGDQVEPTVASVQAWLAEQPPNSHLPLRNVLNCLRQSRTLAQKVAQLEPEVDRLKMRGNRYKNQRDHERSVAETVEQSLRDDHGKKEIELLERVRHLEAALQQYSDTHSYNEPPPPTSNPLPPAPRPTADRRHTTFPDAHYAESFGGPSTGRHRHAAPDSDPSDDEEVKRRTAQELLHFNAERMTASGSGSSVDRPLFQSRRTEPAPNADLRSIFNASPTLRRDAAAEHEALMHERRVHAYEKELQHTNSANRGQGSDLGAHPFLANVESSVAAMTLGEPGSSSNAGRVHGGYSSGESSRQQSAHASQAASPTNGEGSSSGQHSQSDSPSRGLGLDSGARADESEDDEGEGEGTEVVDLRLPPLWQQFNYVQRTELDRPGSGGRITSAMAALLTHEEEHEPEPETSAEIEERERQERRERRREERAREDPEERRRRKEAKREARRAAKGKERADYGVAAPVQGPPPPEEIMLHSPQPVPTFVPHTNWPQQQPQPAYEQQQQQQTRHRQYDRQAHSESPPEAAAAERDREERRALRRQQRRQTYQQYPVAATQGPYTAPVTNVTLPSVKPGDENEYFPAPGPSNNATPAGGYVALPAPSMYTSSLGKTGTQIPSYTPAMTHASMPTYTPAMTHAAMPGYTPTMNQTQMYPNTPYTTPHAHLPLPPSIARQHHAHQASYGPATYQQYQQSYQVAPYGSAPPPMSSRGPQQHPSAAPLASSTGGERRTRGRTNSQPEPPQFPPGSYNTAAPQLNSRSFSYTAYGGPYSNPGPGYGGGRSKA